MYRFRDIAVVVALLACNPALHAQSASGKGWSSWGALPFRGGDFKIVKAPTRYILYFNQAPSPAYPTVSASAGPHSRAFSTDLKNWTLDPKDVCSTSGDLCAIGGILSGVLPLSDGRIRMFLILGGAGEGSKNAGTLYSAVSSDGVSWTREPGVRFAPDTSSIYEQGQYTANFVSFVTLPDGTVRMYYPGQVVAGRPGTPSWYNASGWSTCVTLSAISKDQGLTWVREPGIRVNPLVHGPVSVGGGQNQFDNTDITVVTLKEDGRMVVRIYSQDLFGNVSYISEDGLTFALEGRVPSAAGDPKAALLPDGRIWLITNQFPDSIADMLVYGSQSLFLNSARAPLGAASVSGALNPFTTALLGVTGTSSGPVTFEAVAGDDPNCSAQSSCFHPEYFTFSPSGGTPPFSTAVSYTGPGANKLTELVVHAKSGDVTAAGAVFCTNADLGFGSAFCKTAALDLPMNTMTFAFSATGSTSPAPLSQASNILSLGGQGYPFTASSSVPWATVSPANGTAPMPLRITVAPAGLAPGSYTGSITISAEGTTEQIAVTAVVSAGPVITGVGNAAAGSSLIGGNSFVSIFGAGFAASPVSWAPSTSLPATLGGVSVKINGKAGFISYANNTQINVLAPSLSSQDTASGSVQVEVTTAFGNATASVPVVPVGPAWFTYTNGGPIWISALIANTTTLVAPAGIFGLGASRSARAGDFLALYANGLGAISPAAPEGVVLTTAYPLDDLSRVRLTIGGREVPVLYAGLVGAGLYQINVQVPSGLGTGDLPVVMMVSGQPTQDGATLNFQ